MRSAQFVQREDPYRSAPRAVSFGATTGRGLMSIHDPAWRKTETGAGLLVGAVLGLIGIFALSYAVRGGEAEWLLPTDRRVVDHESAGVPLQTKRRKR